MERQAELLRLRIQEGSEAATLRALSAHESRIEGEKQSLLSTPEFLELGQYEDALRSKGDAIHQFFQPLTKPLLKLERIASVKQASIDIKLVHGLIDKPAETVATNQTFAVMQLLNVLEEKLNQHVLEFDQKRLRKAQETIVNAREGAINKMREEYLALQANLQETLRQLKSKGLLERREALEGLVIEKRTQIEEASAKKAELKRKMDALTEAILKQKAAIESQVSTITGRSILILTE